MTRNDLFDLLCTSLRDTTHVGEVGDDALLYELPIGYPDLSSIELKVRRDGTITDDGRTLLRFMADDRLEALEQWEEFSQYCRAHSIAREGVELKFSGDDRRKLFSFIDGIRRLEDIAPSPRSASEAFNDVIKRGVKAKLNEEVDADRLTREERDGILRPKVTVDVRREPEERIVHLPVSADFQNRDGTELYTVLSYGGETETQRMNHIKQKLALLDRVPDLTKLAVIPRDSEYGEPERTAIRTLLDSNPLELGRDEGDELARRLLRGRGPFHP